VSIVTSPVNRRRDADRTVPAPTSGARESSANACQDREWRWWWGRKDEEEGVKERTEVDVTIFPHTPVRGVVLGTGAHLSVGLLLRTLLRGRRAGVADAADAWRVS